MIPNLCDLGYVYKNKQNIRTSNKSYGITKNMGIQVLTPRFGVAPIFKYGVLSTCINLLSIARNSYKYFILSIINVSTKVDEKMIRISKCEEGLDHL